jgi:hypothetical protein
MGHNVCQFVAINCRLLVVGNWQLADRCKKMVRPGDLTEQQVFAEKNTRENRLLMADSRPLYGRRTRNHLPGLSGAIRCG